MKAIPVKRTKVQEEGEEDKGSKSKVTGASRVEGAQGSGKKFYIKHDIHIMWGRVLKSTGMVRIKSAEICTV